MFAGRIFDPQLALVAFHTAFNLLGVLALIGFTGQFATLAIRLVPERGPRLTARLDDRFLADTGAAVDALVATVAEIARALFAVLARQIRGSEGSLTDPMAAIGEALETAKRYSERIGASGDRPKLQARHASTIHALNHLVRLYHRCQHLDRVETITADPTLSQVGKALAAEIKDGPVDGLTVEDKKPH